MSDPKRPFDEPLIEGLDLPPEGSFESPDISGDHREAVYRRTALKIRGYRRRRVLRSATLLLAVFLAGAGSGLQFSGPEAVAPAGPRTVETVSPALPSDPRDLDRKLRTAPPEERRRILRHAGDSYLAAAEADPGAAMHCYRQLLKEEGTQVAEADDSWLLLYLKLARSQEAQR
jgi:hypothetical protein